MLTMTAPGDTMKDVAIASVEDQFSALFRRVKAGMRDRAERIHPEMPVAGFLLLSLLERRGPTHAGRLAELLEMDKSIVSRQARWLEEVGLLRREADPADRRATFFALTEDAVRRVAEVRSGERTALYEQLRTWKTDDLDRLAELLALLNEAL